MGDGAKPPGKLPMTWANAKTKALPGCICCPEAGCPCEVLITWGLLGGGCGSLDQSTLEIGVDPLDCSCYPGDGSIDLLSEPGNLHYPPAGALDPCTDTIWDGWVTLVAPSTVRVTQGANGFARFNHWDVTFVGGCLAGCDGCEDYLTVPGSAFCVFSPVLRIRLCSQTPCNVQVAANYGCPSGSFPFSCSCCGCYIAGVNGTPPLCVCPIGGVVLPSNPCREDPETC